MKNNKLILFITMIFFISLKIDYTNKLSLLWKSDKVYNKGYLLFHKEVLFLPMNSEYAIDVKNGKKLFFLNKKVKNQFTHTFSENWLLLNSNEKFVILDLKKGNKILDYNRKRTMPQRDSPRLIKDSIIYICLSNKSFHAYNWQRRKSIWEVKSLFEINDFPIKKDNNLYLTDCQNFYEINKTNGHILWKLTIGKPISNFIIMNNNVLYISEKKGLVSVNTDKRKIDWVVKPYKGDILNLTSYKIVSDSSNLFFQSRFLYSINKKNGKINWINTDNNFFSGTNLMITSNYILSYILIDNEPELVIVNKNNGNIIYNEPDIPIKSSTHNALYYNHFTFADTIWNNMIFASGIDTIYAFKILNE